MGPLGDSTLGNHWEETELDPISHIFVTFDKVIVTSIQFGYVKNGALVLSKKYGSKTGPSSRIVSLHTLSSKLNFFFIMSIRLLYSNLFTGEA